MATKVDLIINSLDGYTEKKRSTKIPYVNPNITNAQALQLGQALNALTENSYQTTQLVKTTTVDFEGGE